MSEKQQEGKLYTKAQEIRDALNENMKDVNLANIGWRAVNKLQNVIDEAKAEAPNEKDEKYRDYYPDKIHYHFKYDEFINDFNRWFMKWFGVS